MHIERRYNEITKGIMWCSSIKQIPICLLCKEKTSNPSYYCKDINKWICGNCEISEDNRHNKMYATIEGHEHFKMNWEIKV